MTAWLQFIHALAGLVVLAEALNKLERTTPCRPGLGARERTTEWLKAIAWLLLALGGGGALASPLLQHLSAAPRTAGVLVVLMPLQAPTLQDVCIVLGFAVLIVRTRVKEG
ncbi:hypothetical protein [Melaminivora sp.]|uniref:hypothetical protein n=1 Tax=Melaminivora sp. TaxID=1933032 RepID=UPI0028AE888F|nr:hypothetical protein [Melaminivora sp.]